jgi:outer membrane protein assembly factor BamA
VNPAIFYERTINEGYYGIGNASSGVPPPGAAAGGRYFQYDVHEVRLRELTRITLQQPWSVMVATTLRYDVPDAYPQSRLADDVAAGAVFGYQKLLHTVLGAGIIYDTRDNEFFPHRGAFHQVGLRGVVAFPTEAEVRYGAFGANLAGYAPLGLGIVLAGRVIVDAEFGNVPFYDLHTGGPFWTYSMIGGGQSVRGVPVGRYSGPLKVVGNVEARSLFASFKLFAQRFRVGAEMFFDIGRLWSDYTFTAPEDGDGLGLKWGAGAGAYLVWGQAAIFRIEAAYSPDALSENPNLPIGIYVSDGVMF